MRKPIIAELALLGVTMALTGEVHAYVNYPWCAVGITRGLDCVFASREQCAEDGRGRGFGTQCMQNPSYNPRLPSVVDQGRQAREADQRRRSGR